MHNIKKVPLARDRRQLIFHHFFVKGSFMGSRIEKYSFFLTNKYIKLIYMWGQNWILPLLIVHNAMSGNRISLNIQNVQTKGPNKKPNKIKAIVENLNFPKNMLNFVCDLKPLSPPSMKETGSERLLLRPEGVFQGYSNLTPLL